jgi:hypothetical protein
MSIAEIPDSGTAFSDDVNMLTLLQSTAEQSQPAGEIAPTIIPVAWMGRTSADDQQDPTLSLARQLENCRTAPRSPPSS